MHINPDYTDICKEQFGEFSQAIAKCGFDGPGFSLMLIMDKKQLIEITADEDKSFPGLTLRDKEVMRNRIALFSRK